MKIRTIGNSLGTALVLMILTSGAFAGTTGDSWTEKVMAEPCINGDVPASGVATNQPVIPDNNI